MSLQRKKPRTQIEEKVPPPPPPPHPIYVNFLNSYPPDSLEAKILIGDRRRREKGFLEFEAKIEHAKYHGSVESYIASVEKYVFFLRDTVYEVYD